ncbi:zinc knuckle CX2CX4HX4C containing protein, partial [Tanacetum coccineum]
IMVKGLRGGDSVDDGGGVGKTIKRTRFSKSTAIDDGSIAIDTIPAEPTSQSGGHGSVHGNAYEVNSEPTKCVLRANQTDDMVMDNLNNTMVTGGVVWNEVTSPNMAAIFGRSITSLKEINTLTRRIEYLTASNGGANTRTDGINQSGESTGVKSGSTNLKPISIAFPIIEYYVRNNCGKYGLTRIMMNSKGFFFFKFDTSKGLEDVLEARPWMIHNSLIILKKWTVNTSLLKEELTRILVWVKIHDVPLQVFSEDGISLIATNIGKLIMPDSYTSDDIK